MSYEPFGFKDDSFFRWLRTFRLQEKFFYPMIVTAQGIG